MRTLSFTEKSCQKLKSAALNEARHWNDVWWNSWFSASLGGRHMETLSSSCRRSWRKPSIAGQWVWGIQCMGIWHPSLGIWFLFWITRTGPKDGTVKRHMSWEADPYLIIHSLWDLGHLFLVTQCCVKCCGKHRDAQLIVPLLQELLIH